MIPAVLPTYNRAPLAFVKGEGSWLWSEDGARYLDLGGGIADGRVSVSVAERAETTTVEFHGAASDLPQARLAEFLEGSRQPESADLRLIVAIRSEVAVWGGQADIDPFALRQRLHEGSGDGQHARPRAHRLAQQAVADSLANHQEH